MAHIYNNFKKKLRFTPQVIFRKILRRIAVSITSFFQKRMDQKYGTRISRRVSLVRKSYIDLRDVDYSSVSIEQAMWLSQSYSAHKFDLLGSGWVQNSYSSIAIGIEGYRYDMNISAPASVAETYCPIDWQKDFKSGFRWCEKTWYRDIKYGEFLGVDIKVPWELSRFQHLPQLAIFSVVLPEQKEQNLIEFKNQVLDFIQNNPPRFGVNWVCTMDVGIRAANMLLAYDLFTQLDDSSILDEEFKQKLANSIYEHGIHIVNNLEYSENLTSNHYLSDIAGLLFISAYLDSSPEVDKWLAFSIQEIISEMRKQFYEDGGNFESSTSYHRLSGELMIFSTALILGLKPDKISSLTRFSPKKWRFSPKLRPLENQEFKIDQENNKIIMPQWFIDRFYKIGRFTVDITKPNGEVPQFGDNDSGRFFRFSPVGEFLTNKEAVKKYLNLKGYPENDELFWDENSLDHSSLISCFYGIFNEPEFKNSLTLESSIIRSICNGIELSPIDKSYKKVVLSPDPGKILPFTSEMIYNFAADIGRQFFFAYPDSGIYVFKNEKFYLAICATPNGQNGAGGHTHNDKSCFELFFEGKDLVRDPGTYLYTPLPDKRNLFRSTKAHNVPIVGDLEQAEWFSGIRGLFNLVESCGCKVLEFGLRKFSLLTEYNGLTFSRKFILDNRSLRIVDSCSCQFCSGGFMFFSNGYGKNCNVSHVASKND